MIVLRVLHRRLLNVERRELLHDGHLRCLDQHVAMFWHAALHKAQAVPPVARQKTRVRRTWRWPTGGGLVEPGQLNLRFRIRRCRALRLY